jgi:hypothetical protein
LSYYTFICDFFWPTNISKHTLDIDKAVFLVHLQYVYYSEAACRVGLLKQIASNVKKQAKAFKAINEA